MKALLIDFIKKIFAKHKKEMMESLWIAILAVVKFAREYHLKSQQEKAQ